MTTEDRHARWRAIIDKTLFLHEMEVANRVI